MNVNGYYQTTAYDVEITMLRQDVDVMCIVATKKRLEDKDKIKMMFTKREDLTPTATSRGED